MAAAGRLRARGVGVTVLDAASAPAVLPTADLVIDAAFGTGFRGEWAAPDPGPAAVLACDIPSGVDGLTGEAHGARPADATVTFAALKPGLLLAEGAELAGEVEVADIGLDVSSATAHLMTAAAAAALVPRRSYSSHKWQRAVRLVAGSPGMRGAGRLCASAALRAGAGMVVCSSPGVPSDQLDLPVEAVGRDLPGAGWVKEVLSDIDRFGVLAIGPGLGRDDSMLAAVRELLVSAELPVVVDADGLAALADHPEVTRWRRSVTVLTPHDGEFAVLTGASPAADRFDAVRQAARHFRSTVLLKGPTTLVADHHGELVAVTSGDQRLATAGSGDVLTGIIAAMLDEGDRVGSVGAAAWVHGSAGARGPSAGLVAGDLPALAGDVVADLAAGG
jgi:NAD(P)H-hydrate epimerase